MEVAKLLRNKNSFDKSNKYWITFKLKGMEYNLLRGEHVG